MAGSGSAEERLNKIVQAIAYELGAEVCSCYVRRAGDILELFATIGLNPDAVRRTRLRIGEGIVGEVAASAKPLALADAPTHPSFAYRPETDEDPYHSMVGVPILRGGRVRGVLAIQNAERRHYSEATVELLETVAMILAELIEIGAMVDRMEVSAGVSDALMPMRLSGQALAPGMALGTAVLHNPRIIPREVVAEDPKKEIERLEVALARMLTALDTMIAWTRDIAGGGEPLDIIESYRMFANDNGWLRRIREAIQAGLTAESAVQRVQNDMRVRLSRATDPIFRERLSDLDDLANRLLQHLSGRDSNASTATLPDFAILVAKNMGPAELLDYDHNKLVGIVVEEASAASHVAIVARALGIPAIGQCRGITDNIEALDNIIVDCDHDQVLLRPADEVQEQFLRNVKMRAKQREQLKEMANLPSVSADGQAISIQMNAGMLIDMPHLHASGADGVGLYRTEVPFMVRNDYPSAQAQEEIYRNVLDHAEGRPVAFRTLDIGGDKLLPYLPPSEEDNPAMGWRALRIGLDRPAMLRAQLRALLRAAAGRDLKVMFPFVATVDELRRACSLLDMEREKLAAAGEAVPEKIERGLMLEIPSTIFQIPAIAGLVDFVSIGSNDLLQYFFAVDRTNERLADRYDPLNPSFLKMLDQVQRDCAAQDLPLSICGEMASRPIEAMALLGLGYRTLSVSPFNVVGIKRLIRATDIAGVSEYLHAHLDGAHQSLRQPLKAFAVDHGIPIKTDLN
ncbi:MAG: phosphoenolpyruvate--protein phosphotransferase [Alphaproteobacteria bacterium]|nr:phosphoenolpyruvate--protein phosphotransferase [Alphaproteobacteria bacterium SS10]